MIYAAAISGASSTTCSAVSASVIEAGAVGGLDLEHERRGVVAQQSREAVPRQRAGAGCEVQIEAQRVDPRRLEAVEARAEVVVDVEQDDVVARSA